MARSFQQMIILGSLSRDPEVRYTSSGTAVATLTIPTSDYRPDKATGEKIEETEWHRVIAWGRLAEIAEEYLRKGRMVFIVGKKKTRKWKDGEGNDRYTTEIVATIMQIVSARYTEQGDPDNRAEPGAYYSSQDEMAEQFMNAAGGSYFNDFDDDVPV